jgi:GNAT superfamily N-acetyltransferase
MTHSPTDAQYGLPARELSDAELERQGTYAHATRNWVFLHGTVDQFRHHTERMLELEQEYLRRHPKRTWQGEGRRASGRGGRTARDSVDRVEQARQMLRTFQMQMDGLLGELAEAIAAAESEGGAAQGTAVLRLLERFSAAPGGRLHKLEAHQAARELGLRPADVAKLYKQDPPLLATERAERVLTEEGRRRLVARSWTRESPPCWDAGKAEAFGGLAPAMFGLGTPKDGEALADEWWRAEDGTGVLGYGRLDEAWGDAEILMVVHPKHQGAGVGGFLLEQLEREALVRGLNYVYNVVPVGHPRQADVAVWLRAHGFVEKTDGEFRKRVAR